MRVLRLQSSATEVTLDNLQNIKVVARGLQQLQKGRSVILLEEGKEGCSYETTDLITDPEKTMEQVFKAIFKHIKGKVVMGNKLQLSKGTSTWLIQSPPLKRTVTPKKRRAEAIIYLDSSKAFSLPEYPDQLSHRGIDWLGGI